MYLVIRDVKQPQRGQLYTGAEQIKRSIFD